MSVIKWSRWKKATDETDNFLYFIIARISRIPKILTKLFEFYSLCYGYNRTHVSTNNYTHPLKIYHQHVKPSPSIYLNFKHFVSLASSPNHSFSSPIEKFICILSLSLSLSIPFSSLSLFLSHATQLFVFWNPLSHPSTTRYAEEMIFLPQYYPSFITCPSYTHTHIHNNHNVCCNCHIYTVFDLQFENHTHTNFHSVLPI
jgi:hypothetical protein